MKVWNTKFGSGFSDYDGGRTADAIVEFMNKEGKPLISEIANLSEVSGSKPSFVLVGNPESSPDVKKTASEKKAHLNFYWAASVEGSAEGSLLFVEDGKVAGTLAAGGDVNKFVSENAYPLVGQLTPENYQFYMERGLDMFWFGLTEGDSDSVAAIKAGVQNWKGK